MPDLNHLISDQIKFITLSEEEEKFNLVLEASEDLIFILDSKGCFKIVNDNGAALLDYNPRDFIGRHFWEFVDPKSDRIIAKSFQEILKSGELTSFEVTLTSKFGREVIFQITAKTINSNVKYPELLAVAKDITKFRYEAERASDLSIKLIEAKRLISIEKNRANRRNTILEELSNLKNEFAANISHEFRTPLASIIGYSEAILSDPQMSEEIQTEFNTIILRESKRLANLVNNVLNLSKIESGEIKLERNDFNIIKLLYSVVEKNRPAIKEKGITITCDIPVDEIIINGDEKKLELVFEGLLNNAIKFTEAGGRMMVSAQSLYKEFEIIISDTGIGIPENDLPNIFQKFYRVRRPGKEIPGTGLGLVFVKQIVDLHKGLITVNSEVNMGTSFVIKLPKGIKIHKNK